MRAEGRLNPQTEYDLSAMERRKKELEVFFGVAAGKEDALHYLMEDIEELSDEIHDSIRDKQLDGVDTLMSELATRWQTLRDRRVSGTDGQHQPEEAENERKWKP